MALKILNDIPYVSASRIKLWERCKEDFYLRYIRPLSETYTGEYKGMSYDDDGNEIITLEDNIHLQFGSAIHGAIEDFWVGTERKKKDLVKCYEDRIVRHVLTDKFYYDLGVEIINDYFKYLINDAPKRKCIGIEIPFDVNVGDAVVKGRIDQIFYRGNGVYEIVDYKTNRWLPSQEEINNDIQLGIYDIAFRDESFSEYWIDGKKPKAVLLTMHFLRHYPMHTEYSYDDRQSNMKYIQLIFRQMQIFRPEQFNGTLDRFCDDECSMKKNVIENDSMEFIEKFDLEDFEERMLLVEELQLRVNILNDKLAELNDEAIEVFKENLPYDEESIIVGDKEYYLNQGSRRNLNMKSAIKILEDADLWDPMDYINYLPLGKIESLTSEHEDVWFKLERKAIYKTPTKVSLKSRKASR